MMSRIDAVSTNSVTLSETVRRQSSNTSSCGISAATAPVRWSVTLTAAYQIVAVDA